MPRPPFISKKVDGGSGLKSEPMHYGLDDRPSGAKLWVYTIQFLAFSVANSAVIPVLVGSALGLQGSEIASLVQRTFFFCAVGSFLQVLFGHRYPIFEGPAGIWSVSYTHLRAHETRHDLVCRLLLEKKKNI